MIQVGKQIQKVLAQKPSLDLPTLAKLARIGPARLAKIVHQNVHPSVAELERLAHALGVEPSFLVEEEEPLHVEIPLDAELVQMLQKPRLALSLWRLSQIPDEERNAIATIIESFAGNPSATAP